MFTKPTHLCGAPRGRERRRSRQSGMTLLELLIASGLSGIVLIAIMSLILYAGRSYAALVNYVDLDNFSRSALDEMTSEIREADALVKGSPTAMLFDFSDPSGVRPPWRVSYVYNPDARTLVRLEGNTRRVLLEECDFLEFSFFQRNPSGHAFDLYTTAPEPLVDPTICKAVQMRWICSRTIMQQAVNTESVQSARVVIRKK